MITLRSMQIVAGDVVRILQKPGTTIPYISVGEHWFNAAGYAEIYIDEKAKKRRICYFGRFCKLYLS